MNIPILDDDQVLKNLKERHNPFYKEYYAFYSSWYGGIIKNPSMMLVPIDDHMVHRGDAVFEAIKSVGRSIYLLDEHLQRLLKSAAMIDLALPLTLDEMKSIIIETLRITDQREATIRVFLSRGPGNFSVNPYDAIKSQFYVVVTRLHTPAKEKYDKGVTIGKSKMSVKESWLAQVKSCNYLPNVMMKKEAVDRGFDFVISLNGQGEIAEGATENILLIDSRGVIIHPGFDNILKGTTMTRVCELAQKQGIATEIKSITIEELISAREVMMAGTSIDILPVVSYEAIIIGDGKPGKFTRQLQTLLIEDMFSGHYRTPY